jgi:hypothetical protein
MREGGAAVAHPRARGELVVEGDDPGSGRGQREISLRLCARGGRGPDEGGEGEQDGNRWPQSRPFRDAGLYIGANGAREAEKGPIYGLNSPERGTRGAYPAA